MVLFVAVSIVSVVSFWVQLSGVAASVGFGGLLLLKGAGVAITSLLLWYEIDKANPALQKICTAGAKTNCGAILSSKISKIWGLS